MADRTASYFEVAFCQTASISAGLTEAVGEFWLLSCAAAIDESETTNVEHASTIANRNELGRMRDVIAVTLGVS